MSALQKEELPLTHREAMTSESPKENVHNWFPSFCISTGNFGSDEVSIPDGVPQGSSLGPLPFDLQMLPLPSFSNTMFHVTLTLMTHC